MAHAPLGRGFLTGTAKPADQYDETDRRRTDPRWQPGNNEKNLDAVRRLTEPAATTGATVAQPALAWLLTRGDHVVPVPGTRSAARTRIVACPPTSSQGYDKVREADTLRPCVSTKSPGVH